MIYKKVKMRKIKEPLYLAQGDLIFHKKENAKSLF